MRENLKQWLISQRDSDGLELLFSAMDDQMSQYNKTVMQKVRSKDNGERECGMHDGLNSFKEFLLRPLTAKPSDRDTKETPSD